MKRLLKISFDQALLSFIPIISWFCLSIIIDEKLLNVFTIMYPLQFLWLILKSIFATGANVAKEKDKNKNSVMSGILIGTIISFIIFGVLVIFVDEYIAFMNMDVEFYKNFTIYSLIQFFLQLIFIFIIEKLYYEEKNKLANKYSLIYNVINFIVLIGLSLVTENQILIISGTLISIAIYTMYIVIKNFSKFKIQFNIFNCIKYDSAEIANSIGYMLIFLFGLSNALEYGENFAIAITFVALITDTQWDAFEAISIAARIDMVKDKFRYKEHAINAYKLLMLLLFTSVIMFGALFHLYNLELNTVAIFIIFELINFIIYPLYRIKIIYLQLKKSAVDVTVNRVIANIIRFLVSILPTPFCTGLGQVASTIYQFITINELYRRKNRKREIIIIEDETEQKIKELEKV